MKCLTFLIAGYLAHKLVGKQVDPALAKACALVKERLMKGKSAEVVKVEA